MYLGYEMYVCIVITYSKKRINMVRMPILLLVSWTGKSNISLSPLALDKLVSSRDGFGSPAPCQPAHFHTQAGSGAYLRDFSRFPRRRPLFYLRGFAKKGYTPMFRHPKRAHLENEKMRQQSRQEDQSVARHEEKTLGLNVRYGRYTVLALTLVLEL